MNYPLAIKWLYAFAEAYAEGNCCVAQSSGAYYAWLGTEEEPVSKKIAGDTEDDALVNLVGHLWSLSLRHGTVLIKEENND